jgi:hypothetical protein
MSLTQAEADYLRELEKRFASDAPLILGVYPTKIIRDLISTDGREKFLLDFYQGSLSLKKYTFQERARAIVPLVRLDIGKTLRHPNPDGKIIKGSHIHIYREGYDIKFAFPLDEFPFRFRDPNSIITTFEDFARYCNITKFPVIQERLI